MSDPQNPSAPAPDGATGATPPPPAHTPPVDPAATAPGPANPPPAYTPPADPAVTAPPAYSPPPAYAPPPPADAPYGTAPAQPYASQPYAAAPPAPYGGPVQPSVPGRTLGIVALVLAIVPIGLQLVGLILGIVALVQSRKAGHKNGFALAAIIVAGVLILLGVILFFALVVPALTFASEAFQACQAVGFSGVVEVRGIPVDCSNVR